MIRADAVSLEADRRAVRNGTDEEALVVPVLREQLGRTERQYATNLKIRLAYSHGT